GTAAQAVVVICKLRNSLAQGVKPVYVFHSAEMLRVLLADDDPDLTLDLRPLHIFAAIDAKELAVVSFDKGIPAADVAQGRRVQVPIDEAEGLMEDRGAGIPKLLEIFVLQGSWIRLPGEHLAVVQREQAHHVDHGRAADKIERLRGVLRAIREKG